MDLTGTRTGMRRVGYAPAISANRPQPPPPVVETGSMSPKEETPPPIPVTPTLRVRTLGAFAVWRDGQRIRDDAWHRRKAAALFKALLERARLSASPRPTGRITLA